MSLNRAANSKTRRIPPKPLFFIYAGTMGRRSVTMATCTRAPKQRAIKGADTPESTYGALDSTSLAGGRMPYIFFRGRRTSVTPKSVGEASNTIIVFLVGRFFAESVTVYHTLSLVNPFVLHSTMLPRHPRKMVMHHCAPFHIKRQHAHSYTSEDVERHRRKSIVMVCGADIINKTKKAKKCLAREYFSIESCSFAMGHTEL